MHQSHMSRYKEKGCLFFFNYYVRVYCNIVIEEMLASFALRQVTVKQTQMMYKNMSHDTKAQTFEKPAGATNCEILLFILNRHMCISVCTWELL